MAIDRARAAAVVHVGLAQAGVQLDADELAELESLTAAMLEGLDQLDELNPTLDEAEPALIFAAVKLGQR